MAERRKRLEESARILRLRLDELHARPVTEVDRPMHEVALDAVRRALTDVGRPLTRAAA